MTVVYPLTSQLDYTELKYSLRSIQKFLKHDEIVIVGSNMPDWITNVTQIELPDVPGQPQLSVRRKVLAALKYTDEIFFMNDDIYLLEKVSKIPYYSSGVLSGKAESGAKPVLKKLESLGKPIKYYGHYPSIYMKDFIHALEHFTPECITKSAYCNFIEVESTEVSDCKLLTAKKPGYIKEFIRDRPCFSTGIHSLPSALGILQELFPKPSRYEL